MKKKLVLALLATLTLTVGTFGTAFAATSNQEVPVQNENGTHEEHVWGEKYYVKDADAVYDKEWIVDVPEKSEEVTIDCGDSDDKANEYLNSLENADYKTVYIFGCRACGDYQEFDSYQECLDYIDKHVWSEDNPDSTCGDWYQTYKYIVWGTQITPEQGHWKEVLVTPEQGHWEHKCEICGATEKVNAGSSDGGSGEHTHKWEEKYYVKDTDAVYDKKWVVDKEETSEYVTVDCGQSYNELRNALDTLKDAESNLVITFYCKECGDYKEFETASEYTAYQKKHMAAENNPDNYINSWKYYVTGTKITPEEGHYEEVIVTPEQGHWEQKCATCGEVINADTGEIITSGTIENPDTDDPTTEEPENPDTDDPTTEEPENPDTDDPTTEEPENPDTDDPTTEEPENPGTDDPTTEEPENPNTGDNTGDQTETPSEDTENPTDDSQNPVQDTQDTDNHKQDQQDDSDKTTATDSTDKNDKTAQSADNKEQSDKATTTESEENKAPQTGDTASLVSLFTLAGSAVTGGTAFGLRRKFKK